VQAKLVGLATLLVLSMAAVSWKAMPPSAPVRAPQRRSLAEVAQPPERLLVIVIAAGDKSVYKTERGFWRLIAQHTLKEGVHIYLAGLDSSISGPFASQETLLFPGKNSVIPGAWDSTVLALEYVMKNRLPGHKAKHVLRSNVSTFWDFKGLLAWLASKPQSNYVAAPIGRRAGITFPGGNGYIISLDVALLLLQKKDSIPKVKEWDDFRMGLFLAQQHINITDSIPRIMVENIVPEVPTVHDRKHFSWRIKSVYPNHDPKQDMAYWASLYLFFYGPPTALDARTLSAEIA
jgi:hypothetical protein